MFEREIRDTAFVPRWAIIRTIRQQNVAEHSYFVAIYADQIARFIDAGTWTGEFYATLMRYALYHDMDEILSGDISSPAKKVIKDGAQSGYHLYEKWTSQRLDERMQDAYHHDLRYVAEHYRPQLKAIVKTADVLEACVYLADEAQMGNRNVEPCLNFLYNNQLIPSIDKLPIAEADVESKKHLLTSMFASAIASKPSKLVTGMERVA